MAALTWNRRAYTLFPLTPRLGIIAFSCGVWAMAQPAPPRAPQTEAPPPAEPVASDAPSPAPADSEAATAPAPSPAPAAPGSPAAPAASPGAPPPPPGASPSAPPGADAAPAGSVEGRVVSKEGSAALGVATVTLLELDLTVATESDGRFSIAAPPGTYTLRAESDGFGVQERSVTVAIGSKTVVDLALATDSDVAEVVVVVG